jgi:hypothetical protein
MDKIFAAAIAVSLASAAFAQAAGSPPMDARGIPVVSAPATAPAGANQMVTVPAGATVTVNPNQSAVFTPSPASGDMPACSKSVTDHCTQTYEGRGRGKMAHRHHGAHSKHGRRHK